MRGLILSVAFLLGALFADAAPLADGLADVAAPTVIGTDFIPPQP